MSHDTVNYIKVSHFYSSLLVPEIWCCLFAQTKWAFRMTIVKIPIYLHLHVLLQLPMPVLSFPDTHSPFTVLSLLSQSSRPSSTFHTQERYYLLLSLSVSPLVISWPIKQCFCFLLWAWDIQSYHTFLPWYSFWYYPPLYASCTVPFT
jgi:hypothetical protein